jgi:hypothetical protein
MTKDVLPEYHHDLDYLVGMLDWEANVNPEFGKSNKVFPKPVKPVEAMRDEGFRELWITYGTPHYSAKELTVLPGRTVTIKDAEAYGALVSQGHGSVAKHAVSAPTMIRFGEMTQDELFVSANAAREGVRIHNASDSQPLVILKHFGPEPTESRTKSANE